MLSISRAPLPANALLNRYCREGHYTDCYTTVIGRRVTQVDYVTAFYTTWLFRLERIILSRALGIPSSDEDAAALAAGSVTRFSAWTVEDRTENELLLTDFRGATRSWLMCVPEIDTPRAATHLYFGSAVVSRERTDAGRPRPGFAYRALLGFHKLYSRALLHAAVRKMS